jgi:alkaline phosphatase D
VGWLRAGVAALLASAIPAALSPGAPEPVDAPVGLLLTVGEVTAEHATLWVRAEGAPEARVRYAPADDPDAAATATASLEAARDHTARVRLGPLAAGTRYRYEVDTGLERGEGAFVTAPAAAADVPARLAWSGDLGGAGHCRGADGYRIFHALARRAPDVFLFVGDTIYADQTCGRRRRGSGADYVAATLEEFRGKHRDNRADPAFQAFLRSTGVYVIWDDHEVRNNFAGPTEPLMPVARQALLDYWPVEGPPAEPGRLYRSVRWGRHAEAFILDTRQYRSPNAEVDGPDKTMLGPAQREWLLEAVTASDATWKLIVSSVPLGVFTGGAAADSWSSANVLGRPRPGRGFAHERDLVLGTLHARGVRNVVVVSGDVHHAQIIRHQPRPGFVVHELIAGPLAARQGHPRFLDRSLGSRSLAGLGFATNFGEVVADADALHARIVDATGAVRVAVRIAATPPPITESDHDGADAGDGRERGARGPDEGAGARQPDDGDGGRRGGPPRAERAR